MLGWGAADWVAQVPNANIMQQQPVAAGHVTQQAAEGMFVHFTTPQATFIPRLAHALSDLGLVRTCRLL